MTTLRRVLLARSESTADALRGAKVGGGGGEREVPARLNRGGQYIHQREGQTGGRRGGNGSDGGGRVWGGWLGGELTMPGHFSSRHLLGKLLDFECLQIHELGLLSDHLEGV